MASLKWLTRIVVSDRAFQSYFQTIDYAYWEPRSGIPVRVPITEVQVKAQIAGPALHEVVPRDSEYLIFGAAWGGESSVTRVELSADGDETYREARLLGPSMPHQWRLWEFRWRTPAEGGTCTLMARATDERGRVQPRERDRNWGSYVVHHTRPVDVQVR